MKKKCLLLTAVLCVLGLAAAENGLESLRGLNLSFIKIPVYNKQKLQLMLFADSAERQGPLLIGKNTLIEVIRSEANVDYIADGWNISLYPLDAPLAQVAGFWAKRIPYSEALLFSPRCGIDQQQRKASGNAPVFLRSPALDMDGSGFEADFATRIVKVNSDVRITVRFGTGDVEKLLKEKSAIPEKYNFATAVADSLLIDMLHNEIMLIGNVELHEQLNTLTCDRLTAFLSDDKERKKISRIELPRNASALNGVSRILADGTVALRRRDAKGTVLQQADCDHLEYEVAADKITLSGDEELPVIRQGNKESLRGRSIVILRKERRGMVYGNCRIDSVSAEKDGKTTVRRIESDRAVFDDASSTSTFTGHVRVFDPQMKMSCDELRVLLKEDKTAAAVRTKPAKPEDLTSITEFTPASGKRELDRIFCSGNIRIAGEGGGLPLPGQERGKKNSGGVLTAQKGELDYSGDLLTFRDQVTVQDGENTLKCDTLKLYLADRADQSAGAAPVAAGLPAASKTLRKIVADGKIVQMHARDTDVETRLLTMYFQDVPKGAEQTPGMFQSGGVRLVRINCDNGLKAVSRGEKKAEDKETVSGDQVRGMFSSATIGDRVLLADRAQSDLVNHKSEFHDNVRIYDSVGELRCQELYVYTEPEKPGAGKKAGVVRPASVDDDPYDLGVSENAAPEKIALTNGVNLKKIISRRDVVLTRRNADGSTQQAGGDTATYDVAKRRIRITAEPPKRPWLRGDGRRQVCDVISGDLAGERLYGSGNVQFSED